MNKINHIQQMQGLDFWVKDGKRIQVKELNSKFGKLAVKLLEKNKNLDVIKLKQRLGQENTIKNIFRVEENKTPSKKGFFGRLVERINNLRMFGVRATNDEIKCALDLLVTRGI